MMEWKRIVNKPLPLKQRTSSVDNRRDYNARTWYSVVGLLKIREYFVTVDHFSIWRRHLIFGNEDGKNLREYMTQRYASSMIFLSLLLSTELNVLFNSSAVTTSMRFSLQHEEIWDIKFWIGIAIICSAVMTVLGLMATFTVWAMVSAVNENNAHAIFRSSIGQYVAELPGRLIVGSIYTFLLWLVMFFFVLLPVGFWSLSLGLWATALFFHTIMALSSFGRIIMHSGAMAKSRIFDPDYERNLLPHSLHAHLLAKSKANLSKNTSILRQYRINSKPIDHFYSEEELSAYLQANETGAHPLKDNSPESRSSYTSEPRPSYPASTTEDELEKHFHETHFPPPGRSRKRTDSTVRFADEVDVVTSSPQASPTKRNDHLLSIEEASTPLSQLSTRSFRDEPQIEGPLPQAKPPRPGMVKRVRSDTKAADNDVEAFFNEEKKHATPENTAHMKTRPPYTDQAKSQASLTPNDTQDDSVMNLLTKWVTPTAKSKSSNLEESIRTNSRHSHPSSTSATPGLSVLENAAKMQQQWRNSYSKVDENDIETGQRAQRFSLPTNIQDRRRTSAFEAEPSVHELWANSSQSKEESVTPHESRRRSYAQSSTARASLPEGPPPRPPSMSRNSYGNASSTRNTSDTDTKQDTHLTEEEEEAYKRDYGSFEGLPEHDAKVLENELSEITGGSSERSSLLEHNRIEGGRANDMLTDDTPMKTDKK